MSKHLEAFYIPTSLNEALSILGTEGERAAVIAGGSVQPLRLPTRVRVLVDLMRCGLEGVTVKSTGATIGATTTAGAIAAMSELDAFGTGVLREAAAAISAQAVRNQVTLGGNLVGTLSWSDMPIALAALDARVRTMRPNGEGRTLAVNDLFAGHPRKILSRGEVLTTVELGVSPPRTGGAFVKVARTVADLAMVSVAVCLRLDGDLCRDVRIAIGAVEPRALRASDAEQLLERGKATNENFSSAAELAASSVKVRADIRASKEYRSEVLAVAIRRALETATRRARRESAYMAPRRPAPPPWRRTPAGPEAAHLLTVNVDGIERQMPIKPYEVLLDVLRREGIKSVKRGCDEGYCGTCAVLVDGRLLNACLVLAPQVERCNITTAVGIGTMFSPHPIQTALVEEGAVQCGFCTPGMVVAAKSLLDQIPDPSEEEVCVAMDGNLCRCTGYVKPLAAIKKAAKALGR